MNVSSCVDNRFSVAVNECDEICHLRRGDAFNLLLFDNDIIYWKIMFLIDIVSLERNIFC